MNGTDNRQRCGDAFLKRKGVFMLKPSCFFSLLILGACGSNAAGTAVDAAVTTDGAAADGTVAVDAAAVPDATPSCTLSEAGMLTDDNSKVFGFNIASLPASLTMTMSNDMVQPQIRVSGDFGVLCDPADCGGAGIPNMNASLGLVYTFDAVGLYNVQVDNFNTGGNYDLGVEITGDTAACATWQ